jgi:3-deoxy-D-manno-octulosonic-acid transferase
MMLLYSTLILVFSPLVFLSFVWKYGLRRTLRGLPERLGMGAGPAGRTFPKGWLWVHAASVGEVKAAEAFLRAIPSRFPGYGRLLTTTTVAGQDIAEKAGLAECVRLAPVDLPFCLNRLLDRWSPKAAVLVETELWPNWIRGLARRKVSAAVVNGRLSEKTFPRYMRLGRFWEPLMESFARVGVQSPAHASRFLQLGAHPDRVVITGNLKFDVPLPDLSRRSAVAAKFGFLPSDAVWVCGSTHDGEEALLADALVSLRAKGHPVKMLLAPRHVERAAAVGEVLARRGLPFRRRSAPSSGGGAAVLILDTVGELAEAYGLASFAFVGGSLIPRGGQNPLEPARWGVPVFFGPHMNNFREMAELFAAEQAAIQVPDVAALEAGILSLLEDPARAELLGRAARKTAESQRGALEASLTLLSQVLAGPPADDGCCHGG